jgi:hypothetical protein
VPHGRGQKQPPYRSPIAPISALRAGWEDSYPGDPPRNSEIRPHPIPYFSSL